MARVSGSATDLHKPGTRPGRSGERSAFTAAISRSAAGILIVVCMLLGAPAHARDDVTNEYRLSLSPSHPLGGSWSGFGLLDYAWNPEQEYRLYRVSWPNLTYGANEWLQIWGGFWVIYSDYEQRAGQLELRPYVGGKLFLRNRLKWNIYNLTRLEYRALQDQETHGWVDSYRLRSRFGMEIPLTSTEHAWQPRTFYGLVDVEPFYRFDRDQLDPVQARVGIAYVWSTRLRTELIYYAQFGRSTGSGDLAYNENILRLNVKIGLSHGILSRLHNPDVSE